MIRELEMKIKYEGVTWQNLKMLFIPLIGDAEVRKDGNAYVVKGKDINMRCEKTARSSFVCEMKFEGKAASMAIQHLFSNHAGLGETIREGVIPGTDTVIVEELERSYVLVPELEHGTLLSLSAVFEDEHVTREALAKQVYGFFTQADEKEIRMKTYTSDPAMECDIWASGRTVKVDCQPTNIVLHLPPLIFVSDKPYYKIVLSKDFGEDVIRDLNKWLEEGKPPPGLKEKWGLSIDPNDLAYVTFDFDLNGAFVMARLKNHKGDIFLFDEKLEVMKI